MLPFAVVDRTGRASIVACTGATATARAFNPFGPLVVAAKVFCPLTSFTLAFDATWNAMNTVVDESLIFASANFFWWFTAKTVTSVRGTDGAVRVAMTEADVRVDVDQWCCGWICGSLIRVNVIQKSRNKT
jgi:hypothetical protein